MTLNDFFLKHTRAAIAFSGGTDSAYLLYAALSCGARVHAYYVKSAFQPEFEADDAVRLAKQLDAEMTVIPLDVLDCKEVAENPSDRCYHCKRLIFSAIAEQARKDGFEVLLDGTNASDDEGGRPGMKALRELSVLSPLRECRLTKDEIRSLSKEAGLFTWNKPAYACLATRVPSGEKITADKLRNIERAEDYLFSLGFTDFRVRTQGETAKIQVLKEQLGKVLENRRDITEELKKYYSAVTLDLEARDE